jgi:5-methylcytosine-specific restriction endonuclease McrA
LEKKNGIPITKKEIVMQCSAPGCHKYVTALSRSGLCRFHYGRKWRGVDFARPKGNRGELNVHWRGGVADYPNHYEMKKVRKEVLREANYKCFYCGGVADRIHHLDKSKDNHSKTNLVASCHSCNMRHRKPSKQFTSKFRRIYGKTAAEIGKEIGYSPAMICLLHKQGKLKDRYINDEIASILY